MNKEQAEKEIFFILCFGSGYSEMKLFFLLNELLTFPVNSQKFIFNKIRFNIC